MKLKKYRRAANVRLISVDEPMTTRNKRNTSRTISVGVIQEEPIRKIALNRLSDDENEFREGVEATESNSSESSQSEHLNGREIVNESHDKVIESNNRTELCSDSSQGECMVFSKYEMVTGVRASSKFLYVHDIGYLYSFRHGNSKRSVYHCRDWRKKEKKCEAKVSIDSNGVCAQFGTASHTHPSVRQEYENLLLHNRIRDDCTSAGIIRNKNLRNIYDRRAME